MKGSTYPKTLQLRSASALKDYLNALLGDDDESDKLPGGCGRNRQLTPNVLAKRAVATISAKLREFDAAARLQRTAFVHALEDQRQPLYIVRNSTIVKRFACQGHSAVRLSFRNVGDSFDRDFLFSFSSLRFVFDEKWAFQWRVYSSITRLVRSMTRGQEDFERTPPTVQLWWEPVDSELAKGIPRLIADPRIEAFTMSDQRGECAAFTTIMHIADLFPFWVGGLRRLAAMCIDGTPRFRGRILRECLRPRGAVGMFNRHKRAELKRRTSRTLRREAAVALAR